MDQGYCLAKYYGYEGENKDSDVVAFLKKLEPEKLVKHDILTEQEKRKGILFTFAPRIEPYVSQDCIIPRDPGLMLVIAWGNNIPVIIGGIAKEGYSMFQKLRMFPEAMNINNEDFENLLPIDVREEASILKINFGSKIPTSDCVRDFFDYYGMKLFYYGFYITLLSRLYHAKAATYLCRFAFDSPNFNHERKHFCGDDVKTGVAHGDDVSYFFYSTKGWRLDTTSKEFKTIRRMINIFTTFAKTSNPNCEENKDVTWLPVIGDLSLNICDELTLRIKSERSPLCFWEQLLGEADKLL